MKYFVIIMTVLVVVGAAMAINMAAANDCHRGVNTPQIGKERLTYKPDGSAERCRTYSNGVEYCR